MSEQVYHNQGFSAVADEFITDKRTNSYHIAIYAAILMHANSENRAWPSVKRLAELTGSGRSKVKSSIKELIDFGWIEKTNRWDEEAGRYSSNVYHVSRSLQGRSCGDRGVGHVVTGGRSCGDQELDPENHTHKNHKVCDSIIDYLNQKADKSYRHTDNSRKHIEARLAEGFTVEECKRVIDIKVDQWKDDEKMNQYLRPLTLFAPSKFEGYLNEKTKGEMVESEFNIFHPGMLDGK